MALNHQSSGEEVRGLPDSVQIVDGMMVPSQW